MASGDTLARWIPQNGENPATNYATPDRRNEHPVLDFAIGESIRLSDILDRRYGGGGITIYLHFAMSSATLNDVRLETSIERIGDGVGNLDTDGFAAAQNTGDQVVPGTSGLVKIITTTHSNGAQMDSLAAGELFRLNIARVAVSTTDAAGDLELRGVEIKET